MTRRPLTAAWREAPAKVNLALAVTGRRADGYHLLRSVFVRLTLHDHLEVQGPARADEPDWLEVVGDPGLPLAGNLVLRAAAALREASGLPMPGLRYRLEKHIPSAAGLAGGSSDAAAALELAATAWGLPRDESGMLALAARIGADVPFFMAGHPAALVRDIGVAVDPLPAPSPAAGVLLVTPAGRLSTAAVFAEHDRQAALSDDPGRSPAAATVDELADALRDGLGGEGLAAMAERLRDANDLWPAAASLTAELATARADLEQALGGPCLMTGSGPTLVAVYPSPQAATDAAAILERRRPATLRDAIVIASATSSREGSS